MNPALYQDIQDIFAQCGCAPFSAESLAPVCRTALPWTEKSGSLCFVMNREYLETALQNPRICAIILPPSLLGYTEGSAKTLLVASEPETLFCRLHNLPLHSSEPCFAYISPSAVIHPTAILGQHVEIADHVHIGPYSIIGDNTHIGPHTVIGPHAVIGEDGLYERVWDGNKHHIQHFGGVKIGAYCRIGAQSVIARATYEGEDTTIDDCVAASFHVTIGHDCHIGAGTDISSGVCIGGRTCIGQNCWLGIGATIHNTRVIGDNASVLMGSVLIDNVPPHTKVSGNFAIPHTQHLREHAQKVRT